MNDGSKTKQEGLHSLLLLSELESGEQISQREIASRLGIAVGLVNAYLKTLTIKGFVQVKAFPRNRYAYLLTPSGFAEKSRLAYQQVTYFNKLFRIARADSRHLFKQLSAEGVESVAFCGVDEFTEIVYLSLQEARLKLDGVFDNNRTEPFFGHQVLSLESGVADSSRPIIITTVRNSESLRQQLLALGVADEDVIIAAQAD